MIPAVPILFAGNCGSSWFESLLAAHPELSAPIYEPLYDVSPAFRKEWASLIEPTRSSRRIARDVERLFDVEAINQPQLAKLKLGAGLVFKFRPGEIGAEEIPLTCRLIWVRRRNLVKLALSSFKRHDLGISQFTRREVSEPVIVDFDRMDFWLGEVAAVDTTCGTLYDGFEGRKFVVEYEDLLDNHVRVMSAVFRRLNLAEVTVQSNYFAKVTSDSLDGAVANSREFAEYCRERGLSWTQT